CTHTHTHTHKRCTHSHTYIHIHTNTHTHTHTHTYTHTHPHTHTHIHTHPTQVKGGRETASQLCASPCMLLIHSSCQWHYCKSPLCFHSLVGPALSPSR